MKSQLTEEPQLRLDEVVFQVEGRSYEKSQHTEFPQLRIRYNASLGNLASHEAPWLRRIGAFFSSQGPYSA